MGSVALLLIIVGGFLIYEVVKAIPAEASSTSSGSTSTSSGHTVNLSLPQVSAETHAAWSDLLASVGLTGQNQETFLGIIQREAGGNPGAICYAPGNDASRCTAYQKPGDTQGAFGAFQFLNSTWNGLGCTPAAPASPLGLNSAALNPVFAVQCAAKAFQQQGFTPWGG